MNTWPVGYAHIWRSMQNEVTPKPVAETNADKRLRWIYTTTYPEGVPMGMRTWADGYRVDIVFLNGKFQYWCSETFGSGPETHPTLPRYADDIFLAMADAETWVKQMSANLYASPDEDEDSYR